MQRRGGVWQIVRDGDCLQGQAAPQARQGPLGRRVSQVGRDSGIPLRCVLTWHIIRALHWEGQACDTMWGILSACRGERSDRPDRSFWADGSHRWVQTLAFHTKVCKHVGIVMLVGASGSLRALHREGQESNNMWGIVAACRGERLHRRDRGLWADGSHRWVQTLAIHTNVCKHGRSSEHCTGKGRHVTQCEAFRLLAGASGLTGQTGASGQTGLTGGFRPRQFIPTYASMADHQSFAHRRAGIWQYVRHCDCLQERAALQAKPGPLGRRVSQVGLGCGHSLWCMQAWQALRALHREGEASNNMWGIVTACRGERSYRRNRGLWADGSYRWVQTLAFHWDVYWHGTSSENYTVKGRHVTQCEAFRLLAGASGLTGETGASGQTGLTGGFRPWQSTPTYASMADHQSTALGRAGMWQIVRHCVCL